jgi:hypothetical protein
MDSRRNCKTGSVHRGVHCRTEEQQRFKIATSGGFSRRAFVTAFSRRGRLGAPVVRSVQPYVGELKFTRRRGCSSAIEGLDGRQFTHSRSAAFSPKQSHTVQKSRSASG